MQLRVVLLDDTYQEKYDSFLRECEENMFFASYKYKTFLEELLGCTSKYYLAVDENDQIRSALPTMEKDGKYGKVLNSLPYYGSNGGVISSHKEASQFLLNHYNESIIPAYDGVSCFITNPYQGESLKPLVSHDIEDYRIGQISPLSESDELMDTFHYKTRNMVRKAMKSGIKTTLDNDAFSFLKEVHNENMQAIGGLPKSDRFFNLIQKHFEADKDYKIYVAYHDDIPVAAVLLFYYNKTVEYFTPVIKQEYRSLQPLSLLIYDSMNAAKAQGYKYWNWGGTWESQEGVYRFKSRWNAKDQKYYYYIKLNNKAILDLSPEDILKEYSNFYTVPFSMLNS